MDPQRGFDLATGLPDRPPKRFCTGNLFRPFSVLWELLADLSGWQPQQGAELVPQTLWVQRPFPGKLYPSDPLARDTKWGHAVWRTLLLPTCAWLGSAHSSPTAPNWAVYIKLLQQLSNPTIEF